MLVAAAVCPPTPLLALQLDDLRAACHAAIAALREARPDVLIVVGGAESASTYGGQAAGTSRAYEGRLLMETAPYGVGYFAGLWA